VGVPRPAPFQAPAATKVAPPAPPAPASEPQLKEPATSTGDLKQDLQAALTAGGMKFSADAVAQADVSLEGGDLVIRAPKAMTLALRDPAVQRVAAQVL